jgi:tight adherence protein B
LRAKQTFNSELEKQANSGTTDYNSMILSLPDKVRYMLFACVVLILTGFLFFRDIYFCVFLCALAPVYPGIRKRQLIKKRKYELYMQFKDLLHSVSSSLSAGRSVEGAFRSSIYDMEIIYNKKDCPIINELHVIIRKLDNNQTIDSALFDFADRSGSEDIHNFAEVLAICRNTGGNLVEVVRNTASVICQKMDIRSEIDIQAAERKLSQKILSIMPVILLLVISFGSPDYIGPLYSSDGHVVMVFVLALIALAWYIGGKMMDISV